MSLTSFNDRLFNPHSDDEDALFFSTSGDPFSSSVFYLLLLFPDNYSVGQLTLDSPCFLHVNISSFHSLSPFGSAAIMDEGRILTCFITSGRDTEDETDPPSPLPSSHWCSFDFDQIKWRWWRCRMFATWKQFRWRRKYCFQGIKQSGDEEEEDVMMRIIPGNGKEIVSFKWCLCCTYSPVNQSSHFTFLLESFPPRMSFIHFPIPLQISLFQLLQSDSSQDCLSSYSSR